MSLRFFLLTLIMKYTVGIQDYTIYYLIVLTISSFVNLRLLYKKYEIMIWENLGFDFFWSPKLRGAYCI